ncbi:MAG TPA: alanine--glyoxylate aminotransferase family protein, partial [Atribacterota bacterium]|nr:alanine--glyoxylate aminotransferase family protein [Atribacterota bacterium]
MFALDSQLDSILKEGLDNRFERHKEMARLVQKWGKDKFTLFPQEEFASSTVTCIRNNRKLNIERIIQKLADAGFVISNGYGKLKDKTFRIAHMGDVTGKEIEELLHTIDYYILAGGSD